MKEMCLDCYGTGQIRCLVCGGTGGMPNLSLLGEDCLKCRGTGEDRCQRCYGSGFIGGGVMPRQTNEGQVEWSLPVAA